MRRGLRGGRRTGEELTEGDLAVLVLVEDGDHSLHQRVLVQLGHVEDLVRVQIARIVLVDLLEPRVQLLDLLLRKLAWKFRVTHQSLLFIRTQPQLAITGEGRQGMGEGGGGVGEGGLL